MIQRTFFSMSIAFFFTSLVEIALGDLVLNTIGNVQWDRAASPSASPGITFSVSTDAQLINGNVLNSFGVALRAVPQSGTLGSLELNTAGMADTNSVFPAFALGGLQISEASGVRIANGRNLTSSDVTINTLRNLFTSTFSSPMNNATGTFEIYAVPEFSNYFPSTEFDGFKFANVPLGPDVLLGTITVTAVPEPSGLLLLSLACAGAFGLKLFHRRFGLTKVLRKCSAVGKPRGHAQSVAIVVNMFIRPQQNGDLWLSPCLRLRAALR